MIEIYGYKEKDMIGKPVNCLVPALSKEKRDDNLEKIDRLKFFGSQSSRGVYFPVILNLNRHVAIGHDDLASFVVKITSLPIIAGLMKININQGLVKDLNPVPAKYLFGYSVSTIVEEKKIPYKDLIPQLPTIIQGFISKKASVYNNQMCKRILEDEKYKEEESTVIYAVHRDGSQFEIELQLNLIEKDLIHVYITYDRIDAVSKYEKRFKKLEPSSLFIDKTKQRIAKIISDNNDQGLLVSPITEKNSKQQDQPLPPQLRKPVVRSSRISSFGNVDEHKKLFPTTSLALDALPQSPPSPQSPPIEVKKKHPLDDYVILDILGQGTYGMAKLAYRKDDPSQVNLYSLYFFHI
jgi:hypothetical protein